MKMKILSRTAAAVAVLLAAGASQAATITASNGGSVIASPATVGEDNPTNRSIEAFNEIVGYTLLADLAVDGGVISAGTVVDSHMIFLNTEGGLDITSTATFSFSERIIGIMSRTDGANMFASDSFLGGPVTYVAGGNYGSNRGLENAATDFVKFVDLFTIDVGMRVTEPGDWVRVVTVSAVPLPAGMLLLPTGLAGLAFMRRRRKAA